MTGIFFNFYSFGISGVLIFTLLLSLYIFSLKNKLERTNHLGIGFLYITFFILGYYYASVETNIYSAYHRYLTVFSVFPAIIHFGQWVLRYPEIKFPRFTFIILILGYTIAFIVIIIFGIMTISSEKAFSLTGHYWDLVADRESKWVGFLILAYSSFHIIFLPWLQSRCIEKKYAWVIYKISIGMLVASILPNLTNLLSREGFIAREWYLLSLVFMFVPGFFYIILVYIQNTVEKSFLTAKITGVTLVTFILIFQWINFYLHDNTEKEIYRKCVADRRNSQKFTSDLYKISLSTNEKIDSHLKQRLIFQKTEELPLGLCYFKSGEKIYEGKMDYIEYRKYIHDIYYSFHKILFLVTILIIVLFYTIIRTTLIRPINILLETIDEVKYGRRNIHSAILVNDEIGFLAQTFNSMTDAISMAENKIQKYANELEEKVKERTKEISLTLEEIKILKTQQDGDYFLTSLLLEPMMCNNNHSQLVQTEILIKQKKTVEFKSKKVDLGGDFCLTDSIVFKENGKNETYIFIINADAMGKSMQGAGGALVISVFLHSILNRNEFRSPHYNSRQWLINIYTEINNIFSSFNGNMTVSCIIALVKESDGKVVYINSEHPAPIVLRQGKSYLIRNNQITRKIGYTVKEILINELQLKEGDLFFLASDGRDDIRVMDENNNKIVNTDENLFLNSINSSIGNLEKICQEISRKGELVDDFSIIKLSYKNQMQKGQDFESLDQNYKKKSFFKTMYFINQEKIGLDESIILKC